MKKINGKRLPDYRYKLTDKEVKQIRDLLETGFRKGWIADKFGVSITHVNDIGNGFRRGTVV